MQIQETPLSGAFVIEPKVFGDHRGYFYESYHERLFQDAGIPTRFVQDNQSMSHKGILRGLHFQNPPHAQGKLVRVVNGSAYDVIVDIRKSSPTYGKSFGVELTPENKKMLWVPEGFAHGFLTLEDNTIFLYKCTGYYQAAAEDGLMWNDPGLGISWQIGDPILSSKDKLYKPFSEFKSPFI
ncbi:MAG: dTDP-4-dehydrorhamnose 3,5-epimerase [Bacteroidetes bacterium]|nr:dTDP-4-dehydrorhamnose 3,5-epimerase [Bacteroidota bacterium]